MTSWRDVLRPAADALAPWSGARVVRRLRNASAALAVLTLLLPPSPSLGTARQEDANAIAASFAALALVAHLLRLRPWGDLAVAGAAVGPAALVTSLGAGATWGLWGAALAAAAVGASRLRRRITPLEPFPDEDPFHGGPRVVAGLAGSLAAVLVVRTFVVLPIHVPTGSMEPTILGRTAGRGWADHLFVDQTRWLFARPERWDVAVFEYPLQRNVHFVKRVIGLPGESVEIRDGDVWIDGRVARKPPHLQEALWRELFPRPHPLSLPKKVAEAWTPARDGGEWTMDGAAVVARPGKSGPTAFRFVRRLAQGDLRLRCEAELAPGDAVLRVTSRGTLVEMVLPSVGSSDAPTLRVAGEPPVPLACGKPVGPVTLELAVADGLARALVGGVEAGRLEIPLAGPDRHGAEIAAKGGVVRFRDLRLDQDQEWKGGAATSEWTVPEGAYFVLGDNTENSMDARSWRVTELRVRGREAPHRLEPTTLDESGNPRPNLRREGIHWRFTDVDGIERAVPISEVLRQTDGVPAPFVPADHLVGRAAMIFWPWGVGGSSFRPRLLP